ncbi:MAG: ATPase, T2SS/T4P/T4SS family [Pseudomonadales bacterium]
MSEILQKHDNVRLIEGHVEYQCMNGTWKREIWDDSYQEIYETLTKEFAPTNKLDERTFSKAFLNHQYRCQIVNSLKGWEINIRRMRTQPPTFHELNIDNEGPLSLVTEPGLTLFAGPINSGKSSTLSAAINALGVQRLGRTALFEDPAEYIYTFPFFTQREIGINVGSFEDGVRQSARGNFNTIIVQEIRDIETAKAVITASIRGVRVLATIHAGSVVDAIAAMYNFVGAEYGRLLPQAIRGVFCQRLIYFPRKDKAPLPIYESLSIDKQVQVIMQEGVSCLHRIGGEMIRQDRRSMKEQGLRYIERGTCSEQDIEGTLGNSLRR